jgi:hypothetical protein
MALVFALAMGVASTDIAVAQTVNTDASWLATNALPAAGWNTDPSFDTTGWVNASVNIPACSFGADCIWYDGQFSATQFAWLRKTFTVANPVSSAILVGGIDDDCDIYVNGTQVLNDHNGVSGGWGPIDVTPYMVQGVNLIAVAGADNFAFGQNHDFIANLTIVQSPVANVAVPTLSTWMAALLGLLLASSAVLLMRRNS